jgi:hypothetical protein
MCLRAPKVFIDINDVSQSCSRGGMQSGMYKQLEWVVSTHGSKYTTARNHSLVENFLV